MWDPWKEGEQLDLPVHQVLARPLGSGPPPETWEPQSEEIQFFLNEVEDGVWLWRRDNRVTRPVDQLTVRSASGVPIVAPEIQLLYEAKHHLDKDEHDFRLTIPRLSGEQCTWLRDALTIVHPDDPWLEQLDERESGDFSGRRGMVPQYGSPSLLPEASVTTKAARVGDGSVQVV